jgi:hypothetical protein
MIAKDFLIKKLKSSKACTFYCILNIQLKFFLMMKPNQLYICGAITSLMTQSQQNITAKTSYTTIMCACCCICCCMPQGITI